MMNNYMKKILSIIHVTALACIACLPSHAEQTWKDAIEGLRADGPSAKEVQLAAAVYGKLLHYLVQHGVANPEERAYEILGARPASEIALLNLHLDLEAVQRQIKKDLEAKQDALGLMITEQILTSKREAAESLSFNDLELNRYLATRNTILKEIVKLKATPPASPAGGQAGN
jgi:hypothetical protein